MKNDKKRDYNNKFPSVTIILGILRKIGLENWFKFNTLAFINAESEKGKVIGGQIHSAIQLFIETGQLKTDTEYPEEVTNVLHGFALFRKEHPEIELKASEMKLTSEIYKYNGTMDCLAKENGKEIVLDWKSGKAKNKEKPEIYDEHLYQVSAYVYLYNEVLKKEVDEARIVVFAKDKVAYDYRSLSKDDIKANFEEVFLNCLKIWQFQNRKKEGL